MAKDSGQLDLLDGRPAMEQTWGWARGLEPQPLPLEVGRMGDPVGIPAVPYLGRTARVVGLIEPVDPSTLPHALAVAGKLGKPVQSWRAGVLPCQDPFSRILSNGRERDPKNSLQAIMFRAPEGSVNPVKTTVADPAAMSRQIKAVAKWLGAGQIGIARVHPAFLYRTPVTHHGKDAEGLPRESADPLAFAGPEDVCRKLPFAITAVGPWDYDMGQAHRHRIGDAAYRLSYQRMAVMGFNLAGYIRELGYQAVRRMAQPVPVALAAGLGELGRNGLVITEKYGARLHLLEPILTDLPLEPGRPVDFGVDDFCKVCKKCATTCPTNSISHGGKAVINGVEKYPVKWKTCYSLRPYVSEHWEQCLTCATVCPYTKRDTWWHTLAIWSLKSAPVRLRPPVARLLKWVDDRIWGKAPRRRVRWLDYDSGIPPAGHACTIEGCPAHAGPAPSRSPKGHRGYYAPLRENTNRFVR